MKAPALIALVANFPAIGQLDPLEEHLPSNSWTYLPCQSFLILSYAYLTPWPPLEHLASDSRANTLHSGQLRSDASTDTEIPALILSCKHPDIGEVD